MREKIEGRLNADNWKLISWLKKETFGRFVCRSFLRCDDADVANRLRLNKVRTTSEEIEQERVQARAIVDGWLRDAPGTYSLIGTSLRC